MSARKTTAASALVAGAALALAGCGSAGHAASTPRSTHSITTAATTRPAATRPGPTYTSPPSKSPVTTSGYAAYLRVIHTQGIRKPDVSAAEAPRIARIVCSTQPHFDVFVDLTGKIEGDNPKALHRLFTDRAVFVAAYCPNALADYAIAVGAVYPGALGG